MSSRNWPRSSLSGTLRIHSRRGVATRRAHPREYRQVGAGGGSQERGGAQVGRAGAGRVRFRDPGPASARGRRAQRAQLVGACWGVRSGGAARGGCGAPGRRCWLCWRWLGWARCCGLEAGLGRLRSGPRWTRCPRALLAPGVASRCYPDRRWTPMPWARRGRR